MALKGQAASGSAWNACSPASTSSASTARPRSQIVEKVALDSVPPIRRKVYEALAGGPKTTREVATAINLPTSTARRALEDITAHRLATRQRAKNEEGNDSRDDIWTRIELTVFAEPAQTLPFPQFR